MVCDALILDPQSRSDTYPYIEIEEQNVMVGHEASVSRIGEEQLFYLCSRGLSEAEAATMIVSGFIEPLVKELPMEYAVEMNRLIELQMEGTVGWRRRTMSQAAVQSGVSRRRVRGLCGIAAGEPAWLGFELRRQRPGNSLGRPLAAGRGARARREEEWKRTEASPARFTRGVRGFLSPPGERRRRGPVRPRASNWPAAPCRWIAGAFDRCRWMGGGPTGACSSAASTRC